MNRRSKQQRGAALILVLGVMAVISILATQILETSRQSTQAFKAQRDLQQARWYARAGEFYATSKLGDYIDKKQLALKDREVQFPIEQGFIRYELTSLHRCLNLNSLQLPEPKENAAEREQQKAQQSYTEAVWRYLITEHAQADTVSADQLIQRAHDWTDPDELPTGVYGAESSFYASQAPAQRPANRTFLLPSEIRYLEALAAEPRQQILPLICARPNDLAIAINPNDLQPQDAPLLQALMGGAIDARTALNIIEDRPREGWSNAAEFWQQPVLKDLSVSEASKAAIVMKRHYFSLITEVQFGVARFRLISLLHVDENKKTRVLGRRYGVNS
ncbi:type II secretion system minor pseudopilin GspK [Neptunomonas marina]|uniref:Type II secretion system protein K n=1 Tax=Neptunomonas marina TaxID=1815562 RepID=A0A437QAW9_9GAMM|nr:type II secretion system minor pseudopilin GspK [Neptunomonas marina]RVU31676.1 hypothetical protein EOE65_06785 [Neptunomonas marina]